MATLSQKTDEIAALESLKKDLAKFEMKQAKATKADVKVKIAAKIKGIKEQIKAGKTKEKDVSAKQLANSLLRSRKKFLEMSKKDFNGVIRQLSKKPEYSFLKGMSRTEVINDINRKAKPVGWRFKGRNNYKTPTKEQVRKGRANGTVYYENRPNRSDVSQARQLEKGGSTYADSEFGKLEREWNETGIKPKGYNKAKADWQSKGGSTYAKGGNLQNERLVLFYADGERFVFPEKQFRKEKETLYKLYPKGIMKLSDTDLETNYNRAANFEKFKTSKEYDKNLSGQDLWAKFTNYTSSSMAKGGSTYNDGGEIKSWLKDGTKVKWHDPEESARDLERTWVIKDYNGQLSEILGEDDFEDFLDDLIINIESEDRMSTAEVPHWEIKPIAPTYAEGGALKPLPNDNKGLPKLPKEVRNRMGYMAKGGEIKVGTKVKYPKAKMIGEIVSIENDSAIPNEKSVKVRYKDGKEVTDLLSSFEVVSTYAKGGEEEEYIDPIRQAHIDYETEKSERLYNSDAWVDAQRNAEGFAKGGSLKGHGLAIGDEIVNVYRDDIYVLNRGVVYMVDLSSGKRTMTKMSKDDAISTFKDGGEVKEDPQVIRYYFEDDGYEYEKGGSTYNDDPNDLYGAFEKGGEVDINDIEIPVHYTMFEEEMYEYGKGGNTEQKYLVKRVFKNGSKSRVVDENLSEKEAQEMVQEDIENNPKGEYYMLVYTKMN